MKLFGTLTLENGIKLQIDANALCYIEEKSGISIKNFFERADRESSLSDMRLLMQAAMLRHNPTATLAEAGDLLNDYADALAELIRISMPQQTEGAASGGKPQAVTGKSST